MSDDVVVTVLMGIEGGTGRNGKMLVLRQRTIFKIILHVL